MWCNNSNLAGGMPHFAADRYLPASAYGQFSEFPIMTNTTQNETDTDVYMATLMQYCVEAWPDTDNKTVFDIISAIL